MQPLFAVVVAGGKGTRMGSATPKQFLPLCNKPVLWHTLHVFGALPELHTLVLVLPEEDIPLWESLCNEYPLPFEYKITSGGQTRTESVWNGLQLLSGDGLVAIHDGARPLVTAELIRASWKQAAEKGSAIAAVSLKDSIRELQGGVQSISRNRDRYKLVQTPQTFPLETLKQAYLAHSQEQFTDDASVWEAAGHQVHLLEGDFRNIKITTPEDLVIAAAIIGRESRV